MAVIEDRLIFAKLALLNLVADHIFDRTGSGPNVLNATLQFFRRRNPEIWNERDGQALLGALRDLEAGEGAYVDTETTRDLFRVIAETHGVTDFNADRYRFEDR